MLMVVVIVHSTVFKPEEHKRILRNNSFSLASDLLMKIPNGTETKVLSQVMPGTKWKWGCAGPNTNSQL